MTADTFDTLRFAKKLEAAGLSIQQAEAQAVLVATLVKLL